MLKICFYDKLKNNLTGEVINFLRNNKIEIINCKDQNCRHLIFFLRSSCRKEEIINELTFIFCGTFHKIIIIVLGEGRLEFELSKALYDFDFINIVYWKEASAKQILLMHIERWDKIDKILDGDYVRDNLIGNSPAWVKVLNGITEVALFSELPILLIGESGTGKELLSRLVHTIRNKSIENFVLLDCTTIMPELWGSEFFGHEKGSFTGAICNRDGAFALANNGTLFLDEVGELSPYLQSTLLRVIEENAYKKVGCNYYYKTNFRLVCATNKNLAEEVKRGSFRKDLYYRISTWEFHIPTLQERADDIPLLIDHFVGKKNISEGRIKIDNTVYESLMEREYPGNVRELKHIINRTMTRFIGEGPLTLGDIASADRKNTDNKNESDYGEIRSKIMDALRNGMSLQEIKESFGNIAMNIALGLESGNKKLAADRLKITRRALEKRLENGRNTKRTA